MSTSMDDRSESTAARPAPAPPPATSTPPILPASEAPPALKAAKAPVGTGVSPLFGQLIAIAIIGLGVIGVQEALTRSGAISSGSWTTNAIAYFDGVSTRPWMAPAFVVSVVLGVLLVIVVLKPRPRRTIPLSADTGVHLRAADLAPLAEAAAEGASGITGVSAKATRGRLSITVHTVSTHEHNEAIADETRQRVGPLLSALVSPPRVKVVVTNEEA